MRMRENTGVGQQKTAPDSTEEVIHLHAKIKYTVNATETERAVTTRNWCRRMKTAKCRVLVILLLLLKVVVVVLVEVHHCTDATVTNEPLGTVTG